MAKKSAGGGWLTDFERVAGGVFFVLYVVVFPLTLTWIFRGVEALLGTSFSAQREQEIYYYIIFVATLLIFYNFIGKTTRRLFEDFVHMLSTAAMGLVAFYGLNELLYRLSHTLLGGQTNLNDVAISAQTATVGRPTLLILIFIAPFVEEVLFRGYISVCSGPGTGCWPTPYRPCCLRFSMCGSLPPGDSACSTWCC